VVVVVVAALLPLQSWVAHTKKYDGQHTVQYSFNININ
jgi:hypothetical protein